MSGADADAAPAAVKTLTYSVRDLPVLDFLQLLAIDADCSVVADPALDAKMVTLDVYQLPVAEVLHLLARRLGVSVTQSGSGYVLGEVRKEDRAVLIRKVGRMQQEDLQTAVEVMVSDVGKAQVYRDGLVVVADRADVLARVVELLDRVESAPSNVWVVQLYFLQADRRYAADIGFDLNLTQIDIAATFAAASGGFVKPQTGSKVVGMVAGTFSASLSDQNSRLVAKPLFLLLDGEKGLIKLGERIPLPKRTVLENGSVTTSGYDFIEAGFEVDLSLRELGGSSVRLDLGVKVGEVTGYVEEAPIVSEQSLKVATAVQSGGVYLVGSLERQRLSDTIDGVLQAKRDRQSVDGTLEVWLRVQRVGGGVIFDEKVASEPKPLAQDALGTIEMVRVKGQVDVFEPAQDAGYSSEDMSIVPGSVIDWGDGLGDAVRDYRAELERRAK